MIRDLMDVDLARQQWDDGRRRVERTEPGSRESALLAAQIELVVAGLRRRIGQTFTLAQLVDAYEDAGDWARDALYDSLPEGAPPPDTATVTDAAFQQYARGAIDYRP
jgi:hypothetical protein